MTVTWIDIQLRIAFPIPIPCYIIYGQMHDTMAGQESDVPELVGKAPTATGERE